MTVRMTVLLARLLASLLRLRDVRRRLGFLHFHLHHLLLLQFLLEGSLLGHSRSILLVLLLAVVGVEASLLVEKFVGLASLVGLLRRFHRFFWVASKLSRAFLKISFFVCVKFMSNVEIFSIRCFYYFSFFAIFLLIFTPQLDRSIILIILDARIQIKTFISGRNSR
jgi:hypothetical protein